MLTPSSETVLVDLPASFQYLGVLEGVIGALLGQVPNLVDREARTFEVILAVHEACSNIIEHAYAEGPGRIHIRFTFSDAPRRLIVELRDTGRPFKLPEIRTPNEGEPQTSGYGLFLIHRLMDEVQHRPAAGDNLWILVKNL